MQPRLDRRVRPPGSPALVSPLECVLSTILRGGAIAEEGDEGAEDPAVRVPVEPIEVCLGSRLVVLRRDGLFA
jgi:hypothetical protein